LLALVLNDDVDQSEYPYTQTQHPTSALGQEKQVHSEESIAEILVARRSFKARRSGKRILYSSERASSHI
jgi:hypothetical protein